MKHEESEYSAALTVLLIGFGTITAVIWAFIGTVLKFQL